MSPQEREYFRDRAAGERARAAEATAVAAEIHLELAFLYEKLAELEQDNGPHKPKLKHRRLALRSGASQPKL